MEPRDDPDDAPEASLVEDADAPGPASEVDLAARPRRERSSHAVAALLALAAIVAAIVAARVSFLNGEASGKWQLALRTEVKRSAAVLEDVRYLYQTESSIATAIVEARIRQRELLAAATGQPAAVQEALQLEAAVQDARVDAFEPSSELASDPAYAMPAGGLDLGRRLADLRAKNPDLVALDPHPIEAAGDAAADRALRLTWSGLAIALCVLLGAIAQSFRQWRRPLIAGGAVALGMGVLVALAVELGGSITKPDLVAKTAPGRRFDQLASSLIGFLAVMAAMLAIIQAGQSQTGGRAQSMAARLADDILTRSSVSRLVDDFAGGTQLQVIDLRVDAFARQGEGQARADAAAVAVGEADEKAAVLLQAAMTETIGTSGGAPLDPYTAALVKASVSDLQAEVQEQGRQVDIATAAGGRGRLAILGLSLSALAGVLVGLALVLREGRPGWTALIAACGIASLAVAAGVAAVA